MTILELQDKIEAGEFYSDRISAIPFTTMDEAMQQAQDVLVAGPDNWAGVITPSCADHSRHLAVQREIGIGLRIGGEASLCFVCGPDGGHYHPADGETMESVLGTANRLLANLRQFGNR